MIYLTIYKKKLKCYTKLVKSLRRTKRMKKIDKEPTLIPISRVEKHDDLYNEDLNVTKQQKFNFDDLDNIETLDTSFVDTKKKKVSSGPKVIIESNYKPTIVKKKRYSKQIMLLIILLLLTFITVHFITYDHSKVRTVTKIVTKKVVDNNYLFLGDSITSIYDLDKYYPNMPVVNSGISGNKTTDILIDMKNRVYRYNPSKVFLLIGTNDLPTDESDEKIIKNIEKIIKKIKINRPYAEIYLESIYPINNTNDNKINHTIIGNRTNKNIISINVKLKKYCNLNKVTYIDMYNKLVDKDGNFNLKYTYDGLHPSEDGYKVITKVIKKYIKEK
jgi:lysophospholipase L1-like esterase